ncbi:uncharacterized protein A1O9_06242 [Exophiala aquamarina CBS 119918]|uniref:Major facilitator superfamily (MFS) profile domain-containing protein n=1 Tax=Exophiala aquamarina CBS 119918 TaxID=1182545 RepID=A0A072PEQ7_9EURO|nr:uncharacterized protein A1O9_06242 [Exophiala aquamarina CBS 119918]KEF58316.1 hypothetical protein A1O9_06242 [Exophiala aquamarina CBS 119918]
MKSNTHVTGDVVPPSEVKDVEIEHLDAVEAVINKRLIRKIDFRIIPVLILLFAFSLIDRNIIATARVAGMGKDLDLVGNRYSVALLSLFPLYILIELPTNFILRRISVKAFFFGMVLCWGVVALCHAFVQTYPQLVAVRVLLGLFEGSFQPVCIYIVSSWYTRYETQRRLAIWFALGQLIAAFSGILSYGLSTLNGTGGLEGWRWIYIVPGLITTVLAFPLWFLISEFPEKAKWLKPEELAQLRASLSEDRAEILEEQMNMARALKALKDWKVWLLASLLFFLTSAAYTMSFFTPTILSSLGYSVAMSQILVTPPYIAACLANITTGIAADKLHMRSPFIIGHGILTMVGFGMIGWGPNTGAKMTGIYFSIIGSQCAIPAVYTFLANNVVGTTKRQIAVPLQTVWGGIGGIAGSVYFRQQDYPLYRPGLYASFTSLSLCLILTTFLAIYFWRENRKAERDGKILEGVQHFRYTL